MHGGACGGNGSVFDHTNLMRQLSEMKRRRGFFGLCLCWMFMGSEFADLMKET